MSQNSEAKAARKDLEAVSKRDRTETDDYLRANQRVAEAEGNRSWWKR